MTVTVLFVCWGNICRSPMAERVARRWAEREGIANVEFTSAGTSAEELGEPMDPRAVRVLEAAGYTTSGHRAHQVDAAELANADLIVAMEDVHSARMHRMLPQAEIVLLTDFDPDAEPGSGIPDPWYGAEKDFELTLDAVEAAMPALMNRLRELQA